MAVATVDTRWRGAGRLMENPATYDVRQQRTPPAGEQEPIALFSCSTNASNDVLEHLRLAKLGGGAMAFCLYLHRRTFGDAGFHRRQGRDGTACTFDLGRWAREIPSDKSNVRRIRADLEACHIITFTPDQVEPGSGVIAWNTTYEEWMLYDRRCQPKVAKQPAVVISRASDGNITTAGCFRPPKQPRPLAQNQGKITTPDCLNNGNITTAGCLNDGEITTVACFEGAAGAVPFALEERYREERENMKKPDTVVSGTLDGFAAPSVVLSSPPQSKRPRKLTDEQRDAHNREAVYINGVLAAYRTALRTKVIPSEGQMRAAARWFYRLGDDPPTAEVLVAWYRETKRLPFWSGRFLSLTSLQEPYIEHHGDIDAYRRYITQELKSRQNGRQNGHHNGHATATEPANDPMSVRAREEKAAFLAAHPELLAPAESDR